MNKEITFQSTCDVCGKVNQPCRNHHLVPQRLLRNIPISRANRWKHTKVIICNSCNGYFHPENKLYEQINVLRKQLGYKIKEIDDDNKQIV